MAIRGGNPNSPSVNRVVVPTIAMQKNFAGRRFDSSLQPLVSGHVTSYLSPGGGSRNHLADPVKAQHRDVLSPKLGNGLS